VCGKLGVMVIGCCSLVGGFVVWMYVYDLGFDLDDFEVVVVVDFVFI